MKKIDAARKMQERINPTCQVYYQARNRGKINIRKTKTKSWKCHIPFNTNTEC
jgi:hypothetical protein